MLLRGTTSDCADHALCPVQFGHARPHSPRAHRLRLKVDQLSQTVCDLGTFLTLFLFAGFNVALGWYTANWFARRQAHDDPATAEEAAPTAAEAAPASAAPAREAPAATAAAEQAPTPQVESKPAPESVPATETSAAIESSPEEASTPTEDTSHLQYDEFIDRVSQDCPVTDAFSQVLKLRVDTLRSKLLSTESAYLAENASDEDLLTSFGQAKLAVEDWLPPQKAAREHLEAAGEVSASHPERIGVAERLLRQSASKLESSSEKLIAFSDDDASNTSRVRRELTKLVDACQTLRDAIHEGFATVVNHNRQFKCNEDLHHDDDTGLVNITGLESAIWDWRENKEQAGDSATVIVIDVDGMAQLNQQLGTDVCDQLLGELSKILCATFRKDRGFDVPARISGQRFAGLLGYTTALQAASALERVRQTVEGLDVIVGEEHYQVRVSCAATALQKNVGLEKHIDCLARALEFAKERGGNCTVIWRDDEASTVDPAEFEIESREVRLSPRELAAPKEIAGDNAAEAGDLLASDQIEQPETGNETEPTSEEPEQSTSLDIADATEDAAADSEETSVARSEGQANQTAESDSPEGELAEVAPVDGQPEVTEPSEEAKDPDDTSAEAEHASVRDNAKEDSAASDSADQDIGEKSIAEDDVVEEDIDKDTAEASTEANVEDDVLQSDTVETDAVETDAVDVHEAPVEQQQAAELDAAVTSSSSATSDVDDQNALDKTSKVSSQSELEQLLADAQFPGFARDEGDTAEETPTVQPTPATPTEAADNKVVEREIIADESLESAMNAAMADNDEQEAALQSSVESLLAESRSIQADTPAKSADKED